MPDQRHKSKRGLTVWLTHELYAKFKKRSVQVGMSMTDIVTAHVMSITKNTELTPEDYEEIARRMRKGKAES